MSRFLAVLCAASTSAFAVSAPAGADAQALVRRIGATRGICAVIGPGADRLAIDMARVTDLVLYVQLADAAAVDAARRAADDAGLYGTRVFIERGTPDRIHLADNVADALVAPADAASTPRAEILRVLRPDGKAILGNEELRKPWPEGTDDWSHHYHGPDNNPQSRDRLARAPYLTQFIAEPRYATAPQAAVASGGRLFMAFGHVAWHQREEPWLNTLVALSGFNGMMLWKRPLRQGIMVDRSTMIATPETLYLADDVSCKLLDPATGEVRGEITVPQDLAGGTFWKWMALDGDRLYALVGPAEPCDPDARWRSRNHGWPWDGISKGYNAQDYRWGFSNVMVAIDPATRKVLWHHREEEPIDSRAVCVKGGRIFICHFGKYLACLDGKTGEQVWRRTAEKDADLFEAIGPYRPGHGYVGGWKSTVYLKSTDKALYFVGPQVNWLTAVSADDGRLLWKHVRKDLQVVLRDDGVYTVGPQGSTGGTCRLDPQTGTVLATYDVSRRACTRSTGAADGLFFRATEGTVRLDLASGRPQWMTVMRPSCHVGVVVAHGHLYWVPWACDCNLQMFGAIALAPAGEFKFGQPADEKDRLDGPGARFQPTRFDVAGADWPTYRHDNRRTARSDAAAPRRGAVLWHFSPKAPAEPSAPVTAGGLVFVGFSDGAVRAIDASTGRLRWTAYTGGSVRYPPALADGRALVGSSDGWVYALEAATGRTLWRFRAAPAERKIPVYGALVSTWPVAAGVLVDGGTAYAAAGLNNFDGTSVYALDAATGRIRWQNNDSGHLDQWSRRGVAVQGDLLLHEGRLYLAGGNAVGVAAFSTADGRCFCAPPNAPGSQAPRGRELTLTGGGVVVSGQPLYSVPECPVFDKSVEWADPVVVTRTARLVCRQRGSAEAPAWALVAEGVADSSEQWSVALPAEPVRWGVAIDAAGRIAVALRGGTIVGVGENNN